MAKKYRVDTDKGSYIVETEDPTPSSPLKAVTPEEMPGRAQDSSALARFGGGVADMLNPAPILNAARHPLDTFNAITRDAPAMLRQKAMNAPSLSEGIGNFAASMLPAIGPWAAGVGEQIGNQDYAGAAGQLSVAAAPIGIKAVNDTGFSGALKSSAVKSMEGAFQPTGSATGPMKVKTARVAPELVNRGVTAMTQKGLGRAIESNKLRAGEALEAGYHQLPPKQTINVQPIVDALEKSKFDSNAVIDTVNGPQVAEPIFVEAADKLKDVVTQFGPDASTTSLVKLRQRWDDTVAKGKGFTQPDISIPLDVKRDGVAAIRAELAKANPDIAKLNAEYSLWKTADDVIQATIMRKKGQSAPMGEQLATSAGAAAGMVSGGIGTMLKGAVLARAATKLFRSTGWRTVSAKYKNQLANALMSGDSKVTEALILRLSAGVPDFQWRSPEQQAE